jgi:hypothetical protein
VFSHSFHSGVGAKSAASVAFVELEQLTYLLHRCIVIHDKGWHFLDEGHSSKDSSVTRTNRHAKKRILLIGTRTQGYLERCAPTGRGLVLQESGFRFFFLTVETFVIIVLYG